MLATPQPASKMTGGPGNVPTDLRKPAHGPSRTLKSGPRRAPGASPSTLRATLGSPEELPGAAKPRICKRLQREHQLRPPRESTLYRWSDAAPPVVDLPLTLPPNPVLVYRPCQASPPAGPMGSADSTGLRPLPPTPKEDLVVSNLRMARSDFACEYLDEEFNPDE